MKHFTDIELMELTPDNAHLLTCSECQKRLAQLNNIKQQLVSTYQSQESHPKSDVASWEHFSQHSGLFDDSNATVPKNTATKAKVYPFFKLRHFAAMAACLLIGVSVHYSLPKQVINDNSSLLDNQITLSIEKNSELQNMYRVHNSNSNQAIEQNTTQLMLLDNQIQKAYLAKVDKSTIYRLWQKRQFALKKLVKPAQPNTVQRSSNQTLTIKI